MSYDQHVEQLARHLAILPFGERLTELSASDSDPALWRAVLDEAARVAAEVVAPVDPVLDRVGARLIDGRVVTPPEHRQAWERFAAGGWIGLTEPGALCSTLPLALATAVDELFNRASAAFMMLPNASRAAAALLVERAPAALAEQWVPRLLSGEWAATICISEPGAGSDVGRIRTRAAQHEGVWRITGNKCWISYGDHDLSARIGHCLLARTGDAPGVRGLSLFLVPSHTAAGAPNGITVGRIEAKMGLHGSPTCVLDLEDTEGLLIGAPGEGLQQLFTMMLRMRLSCGPQGTGVAAAALETALAYAGERRQGGAADRPAIAIASHADVQRQLLAMAGQVEVARGLNLAAATAMDLARLEPDAGRARDWSELAQLLLPLVKDGGAWCAFRVASAAVQVLGGAGYTREWPVERHVRDSRVFSLFEGTTGIQALDLLHRRIARDKGAGLLRLLALVRADAAETPMAEPLLAALDRLVALVAPTLMVGDAGAAHLLELVTLVAQGWIAARIVARSGDDATGRRMRAGAAFFLSELGPRATMLADLATSAGPALAGFAAL
ncbi:MAG TPA: acyl-CoA dehydrogenase family protein [Novosphingobium sp.]